LLTTLKKLFLAIGKHLAETIIRLWQSKQNTECELAAMNEQTPISHNQEPFQLFQPSNPDLYPHTESEKAAIAMSASELASVIQNLVVPQNNRKLRPLPKEIMGAVTNMKHQDLMPEINSPVALNSLPDVVNICNQFKDDKFKSPKAHPTLSLHVKFRNAEAMRTQPHRRTLKKAPLKEEVQTSVMSLLKKAKPVESSHRNV